MRVSMLYAGAESTEVERILGRPTFSTAFANSASDHRVLGYADEPIRTEVALTDGRVTAVKLDPLPIDSRLLPARGRMVKPTMVRDGVLALLGKPNADETWMASGLKIEQMRFVRTGESEYSVFFANGSVVDVRPGAEKPAAITRVILPEAVPDAEPGMGLRIGLTQNQAAPLFGPAAWMTTTSSLKAQSVLSATYHERAGCRLVTLTFTGGVLTAFANWYPDRALNLGSNCSSAAGPTAMK